MASTRLLRLPRFLPSPRPFTTTSPLSKRRRISPKKFASLISKSSPNNTPSPYSNIESAELQKHYTYDQLSAILAGESSISKSDFSQRVPRRKGDPMALPYVDDLTRHDPILDFPLDPAADVKYDEDGFLIPAQPLPIINDPRIRYDNDESSEIEHTRRLMAYTGLPKGAFTSVSTRVLVLHGVTNQTRMGKIHRTYVLAVAGNGNGMLGIGEGKSVEVEDAMNQAQYMAMRNMVPIPRYEGRTTFGDVEIKNGAVEMKVFTRPPGFGVRCSQYIFEMCRCAGITDLQAKVTRSRNPMNVIKTFLMALQRQRLPETIARGRGVKLVDVRKVYYQGRN